MHFNLDGITFYPLICTVKHPGLLVSNFIEKIVYKLNIKHHYLLNVLLLIILIYAFCIDCGERV